MWGEVKVGEDVALRLVHSAERQPRGNDIDEHHRGRPANRTGSAETREVIWDRM